MKKLVLLGMMVVVAAGASALAETKVGCVDVQKAIQSTASGKKAKETMEAEFKKRKESLDKKKSDIEKMGQDLEKKRSVLSEEVFGRKQVELQEEMMKFQKVVGENQLDIQKKEKELLDPIFEKMRKVIEKVAQEKGFSVVVDKQNTLYAQKDADMTDDVVKAFEKEK